jgi:hypothetical protein
MLKLMFLPFRLIGGALAGVVAAKLFERIWSLVDGEGTPDPGERETSVIKLVSALLIEGAIFRAARGLADRGSRVAFSRVTGRWPGEKRAAPERG